MASSAGGNEAVATPQDSNSTAATSKRGFLNLPAENIALIFENASDHDLAQLCRVSKYVRELAAAELYRGLNHTFVEDPISSKLGIDYLAGFLETLATSDYNYAAHVKDVYVDTGYAAAKGEQACRQFGYDLTCGKFLNTLLLAVLKRTTGLEGFHWNARIELSTAIFLQLYRMPNLRRLHLRIQGGQSLHAIPKASTIPAQTGISLPNSSPISPGGPPPPPGPHSPGGYAYGAPIQPTNSFRMVPKLPVSKPVVQPRSFSGFKKLRTLAALEMDNLDYIPELAECVRNSLETLKQIELSLSDTLARRARDRPRQDIADGGTSDDASSILTQPLPAQDEGTGTGTGTSPEQTRQWHKTRHEAILNSIFAPKIPDPKAKEFETAVNEVVARADRGSHGRVNNNLFLDVFKDDKDAEFVRMMRTIFRKASQSQPSQSKGQKALEKIEKAATKYLEGKSKPSYDPKPKSKSKSSVIKIKTPKPPPPVSSWAMPPHSKLSVQEDTILDYFGFGKLTWDNMTVLTKNQYLETYFRETAGVGFQPSYPMPPPPPGKSSSYNKIYYANPSVVPPYMPAGSKYVVIPAKKGTKKPTPPKPKYLSDSDDLAKAPKIPKIPTEEPIISPDPLASPTAKKEGDDISDDPDMLFPSDGGDEGPDQEFETDSEGIADGVKDKSLEMEDMKEGMNGLLKESGYLDEEESPIIVGKGKQAVRDPPNGHITPPNPAPEESSVSGDPVSEKKEEEEEVEEREDPVAKYLRLSHGLPIERLAIYLIPVKPNIFLQHFDPYTLKSLVLLNVGSQRRIWATLTKMQRQSPLPLSSIFTDNVSPALLTFLESLESGQLEDVFLLERYQRQKGRVPQLQDCDKTAVDINAIRKQVLKKHMKGLKRLMIRNDDTENWALNNATMRLIGRDGIKLQELAVQCETVTFHTIVRSLPTLESLTALQISFILDPGAPPLSMTGVAVTAPTHHAHPHHYPGSGAGANIEPHTGASATMLHELRQCVVDGITFCRDTTRLEWVGFSWVVGHARGNRTLDAEGNPYVFLTRVVREWDGDRSNSSASASSEDESEDEPPRRHKEAFKHEIPQAESSKFMALKLDPDPDFIEGSANHVDGDASDDSAAKGKDKGKGKGKEKGKETQKEPVIGELPSLSSEQKASQQQQSSSSSASKKSKEKPSSSASWFWAENDLNIADVQGIRMWEKETWAGRL